MIFRGKKVSPVVQSSRQLQFDTWEAIWEVVANKTQTSKLPT